MNDYTWPSIYFAYFFFALCLALAVFFFIRSWKDGYWGKESEDIRYHVFQDAGGAPARAEQPPLDSPGKQELTHASR